jgi:hypothetical protein
MSIEMRARLSAGISQRAGPHKTKVHYPAKLSVLIFDMIATSHIEMGAVAHKRTTPSEKPWLEATIDADDSGLSLIVGRAV